jgi:hypothetical protein
MADISSVLSFSGNVDMVEDFIRIVTDFETDVTAKDRLESNIKEISKEINSFPGGGIFKQQWWQK